MKFKINWKAGILSSIFVAIVGVGFFIFVGSNIDFACKNTTPNTFGCRVYNGANVVVNDYSDIFRSIFAPRCVDGNGPDDCLEPDTLIMIVTLLVIGFVAGNLVWRKKRD